MHSLDDVESLINKDLDSKEKTDQKANLLFTCITLLIITLILILIIYITFKYKLTTYKVQRDENTVFCDMNNNSCDVRIQQSPNLKEVKTEHINLSNIHAVKFREQLA